MAVNHIDSIVKKIGADTNIQLVTVNSVEEQGTKPPRKSKYQITAAYKNGQLLMLQKTYDGFNFFNGSSRTIYFEKDKAVLFIEQYGNSSRMGSCGEISVSFYHYLQDSIPFAGLARSVVHFYTCYGYKLQKPVTKTLFAEIDSMKKELNKRQIEKAAAGRLRLFFIHPFIYANETIQENYGF